MLLSIICRLAAAMLLLCCWWAAAMLLLCCCRAAAMLMVWCCYAAAMLPLCCCRSAAVVTLSIICLLVLVCFIVLCPVVLNFSIAFSVHSLQLYSVSCWTSLSGVISGYISQCMPTYVLRVCLYVFSITLERLVLCTPSVLCFLLECFHLGVYALIGIFLFVAEWNTD